MPLSTGTDVAGLVEEEGVVELFGAVVEVVVFVGDFGAVVVAGLGVEEVEEVLEEGELL